MSQPRDTLIFATDRCMWWGPDRSGYTDDLRAAGRYTATEAGAICADSNCVPFELSIPVRRANAVGWVAYFRKQKEARA